MLVINRNVSIPNSEIELHAIRSQGAGGQNVNKVSSAIHLRFDVTGSSLTAAIKDRLLKKADHRISKEGVIVIKAQIHRTQEKNRFEALQRLAELIKSACVIPRYRIATKPSKGSVTKRIETKKIKATTKKLRRKISDD